MYNVELKEHVDAHEFPISVRDIETQEGGLHIPDKKAIIREDNKQVLGVVSDGYQVLNHRDALNPILDALGKACPNLHRSIHLTQGGARMYANLYMKDYQGLISVDDCWPGITVVNSLDGSQKYRADLSLFRLVCTNGMTIPMTVASFATRHSKNAEFNVAIEEILRIIEDPATFQFVSDLNVIPGPAKNNEDGLVKAIDAVCEADGSFFPKRYSDNVAGYYTTDEPGESLWNFYNAFNSVLEHDISREKGKIERARALDQNLFKTFEKVYMN